LAELPGGGELRFVASLEPDPAMLEDQMLQAANMMEDMTGPLEASRDLIAAGVMRRFRSQSDPSGEPWVEWSESYSPRAFREMAQGIHLGDKLERSLHLRDAATSQYAYFVSYDSVFITWNALPEYAAVQNFGGFVGKGAYIPPRTFMGIDDLDEARIEAVFLDYIDYIAGATSRSRGALGRFVSVKGVS
jgi:phage gpG-like protein